MEQLSLFDLPADSEQGYDGPKMWWTIKYKPMFDRVAADFIRMYEVAPIFYLAWPEHQVFLVEPERAVSIERTTGLLVEMEKRFFWEVDYRRVPAFRPQDVAPQITSVLSGDGTREDWLPMVMAEVQVPASKVETFAAEAHFSGVFVHHWPALRNAHTFRLFGEPSRLERLAGLCALHKF